MATKNDPLLQCQVNERSFHIDEIVLRRVFPSSKGPGIGTLDPNWDGPYYINEELRLCTYKIKDLNGKAQHYPLNIKQLRRY